jgi:hypothetical protein
LIRRLVGYRVRVGKVWAAVAAGTARGDHETAVLRVVILVAKGLPQGDVVRNHHPHHLRNGAVAASVISFTLGRCVTDFCTAAATTVW